MEWTVAIGVDTHKEMHVAVALRRARRTARHPRDPHDHGRVSAVAHLGARAGVPAFAIEGAGSYGAGLVRFLKEAGVAVYECERPRRQERRRGKNDLIDAALAARRLLRRRAPKPSPRGRSARGSASALARASRRHAGAHRRAQPTERGSRHRPRSDSRAPGRALRGDTRPGGGSATVAFGCDEWRAAATRPEGRPTLPRGGRGRARTRRAGHRVGPRSARGVRGGTGLRRPVARLERRSRPNEERGILRRARRHEPGRCLERQTATPSAEPGRRSPAQLGAPRRRPPTGPPPPRNERLLRTAARSGQVHEGSTPLRQAGAGRHFYHRLREMPRLSLTT